MPPAADRSPSSLSSPLSGRRFISRIASPFASKSRSVADFSVEVDDPHKQHSPGDVVTGSVRLRLQKAVRVTHLAVCLHGYVQVYKNPGSPGEGFRANSGHLGMGRGKKSGHYFGNGFASLFEDENVLCGEGRLGEGSYQFNFELQFPESELPSSIDFERGTISYMITATITRPTTISPTITCDRKVYFVESIDISPLYPPKSRTITLEPLSRRSRAKHQARKLVDASERRSRKAASTVHSEQNRTSVASGAASSRADGDAPRSPSPSEISLDSSTVSSSGHISLPGSSRPSLGRSDGSKLTASKANKTITATVEPLAGGCLRGDSIGVRVTVNHTKPIKSMYGVIVTLYRQARVDMHPAIPLGPTEKGVESKYEDYYPRSVTGLGGLSLSGAGSSHLFRKDLAQVMVPLYIDPSNMTAEVNAKVRMPEEVFPTISTVPGAMISFKYFTEVVVDIQGKLNNQDRSLSGLAQPNPQLHMGVLDGGEQQYSATPFGSTIVDTAPIRRDKGVITCTFEVVVGTRDSARRKGKRKMETVAEDAQPEQARAEQQATSGAAQVAQGVAHDPYWYNRPAPYGNEQWDEAFGHVGAYDQHHTQHPQHLEYDRPPYEQPPPPVPMPRLPDESQMSEKERIRQAEARLLPSQPPGMEAEASGSGSQGATAPYIADGEGDEHRGVAGASAPTYSGPSRSLSAATSAARHGDDGHLSSAPAYEHTAVGSSQQPAVLATDDKEELRRRRLETEGSAPTADERPELPTAPTDEPSAPTEMEAERYVSGAFDSHIEAAGSSTLPRYER